MTTSNRADFEPQLRTAERSGATLEQSADRAAERFREEAFSWSPVEQRMQQLERDYNIRFTRGGQSINYRDDGTKIQTRNPTMDELKVLEEVLGRFQHQGADHNGRPNFRGLRFQFADTENGNGKKVSEHGWYHDSTITFGRDERLRGFDGMEGTAIHEMMHHLQAWRFRNMEVSRDISQFFGFERERMPNGEYRNRMRDKDGKLWERQDLNAQESIWLPVENGKVVEDKQRGRTNSQMRDNMPPQQRSASHYFDSPEEAHAEAMTMLFMDRALLFDRNPELYEAAKRWDQKDIDMKYGAGRMMRDYDGNIVANTPENRAQLHQREAAHGDPRHASRTIPTRDGQRRCPCGNH